MSIASQNLETNITALHAVPTADASTDVYVRDVVGKKNDAAVAVATTTKSIMAYVKGLLGLHINPAADATTNTNIRDVVGNKEDAAVTVVGTQKSLMAYIKGIQNLLAGYGTIVQDSTSGTPDVVAVACSSDANTLGTWAQLDASAATDRWLTNVTVLYDTDTGHDGTDVKFCLEIGTGANPSEAAIARFSFMFRNPLQAGSMYPVVFTIPKSIFIASGTRIAARASCSDAMTPSAGQTLYVGISSFKAN